MKNLIFTVSAWTIALTSATSSIEEDGTLNYGVDLSFPIHKSKVSTNYPWLPHNVDPVNNPTPSEYKDMPIQYLGDTQKRYDEYLQGCRDKYRKPKNICDISERDRVAMSLRQPQSMQNYTDIGFKKIKTPPSVWKLISDFWENNKGKENWNSENWSKGNSYVNHWVSPSYMVSVENSKLRGGGYRLKKAIWEAAKSTLQEWTGEELQECSMYGIRVYTEGSMLATHVDRMPLVSSAIINVDQDVDEPWPIEVYGHDGRAYNVTMEPGDMVLYESHSVLHGRPFPMKGRYFANIFIHFEPIGHSLRHNAKMGVSGDVHEKYAESVKNGHGGHENNHEEGLPPYILEGSEEYLIWKRGHQVKGQEWDGQTKAHTAARSGDLDTVLDILDKKKDMIHQRDVNGWAPLHEAVRSGHTEVVRTLVEKAGADFNQQTGFAKNGQTPLDIAQEVHDEDHPLIEYLLSLGAISAGPDL
jgi:prolyl 4-hydroxylase